LRREISSSTRIEAALKLRVERGGAVGSENDRTVRMGPDLDQNKPLPIEMVPPNAQIDGQR
jgi:hypothetical protein